LADINLQSYNTVDLFQRLYTRNATDDVYRLFPVPAMTHCVGGAPSPNGLGGAGQAPATPSLQYDAQHNVVAAMVAWIEDGRAPENITAASWTNNTASLGLAFTRPLCKVRTSPIIRTAFARFLTRD